MPIMYCKIRPFDYDQKMYSQDENGENKVLIAQAPLSELHKTIPAVCQANNISEVYLDGIAQYTVELKGAIESIKTKYSNMELNIHIKGDK